ncbi:MAG: hypothetical protein Q8920_13110 [Bacillota bacterium]|nr:hypothetical protein [Bacillota bacterium]
MQYLEEFQNEQYEYRSYKIVLLRDKKPEEIIKLIDNKLGIKDTNELMYKWKRKTMDFRRITAYVLNAFCGMGINEVAGYMHNITASCCANLRNKGYEIIQGNSQWNNLIAELYEA